MGGFLHKARGRGVVYEIVTDMLRRHQVGALPRACAAAGKHPHRRGINYNGVFCGFGIGRRIVNMLDAVRVAAYKEMVDAELLKSESYGLCSTASAEDECAAVMRLKQWP